MRARSIRIARFATWTASSASASLTSAWARGVVAREDLLCRDDLAQEAGATFPNRSTGDGLLEGGSSPSGARFIGGSTEHVTDFAGCPVGPSQDAAINDDAGRQARTEAEQYSRICLAEAPPAGLGQRRRFNVGHEADLPQRETFAKQGGERQLPPPWDVRREEDPVLEHDSGAHGPDRKRAAATGGASPSDQLASRHERTPQDLPRSPRRIGVQPDRLGDFTVESRGRNGDLGAAEVERQHEILCTRNGPIRAAHGRKVYFPN